MIIIKTENGSELIDEKYFSRVYHDRRRKKVLLFSNKVPGGYPETIYKVESVTYANEAHPTEWKEEGSLVEYLNDRIKNLSSRLKYQYEISDKMKDALRKLGTYLEIFVNVHHEEIPSKLSKELSDQGTEAKGVANSEEGWVFSEYAKKLQQGKQMEADEVMRLNGIINDLNIELENAKNCEDGFNRYKSLCERHEEAMKRIMSRNLIERIINKKTWL